MRFLEGKSKNITLNVSKISSYRVNRSNDDRERLRKDPEANTINTREREYYYIRYCEQYPG